MKKLYRIENGRKWLGVCGGIAEYFKIDATIVRVLWAVLTVVTWSGLFWVYLICAFVMPKKGDLPPEIQNNNVYDADTDEKK